MSAQAKPLQSSPPFDINEGAEGFRLPNVLPGNTPVLDFETYAQFFETLAGRDDPVRSLANFFGINPPAYEKFKAAPVSKALGTVPNTFTYGRMSYMPDAATNGGVIQWPGINPDSLRKVARENVAPQLIIGMRVDDMLRYSNYSDHPWRPGWILEPIDSDDLEKDGTKKDIEEAKRFLMNSNIETRYTQARTRDQAHLSSFQRFLSAGTRDSLTYDGIAVWTDMDNKERVKSYALLPSSQIRLCVPAGYGGKPENFAVAVDEGGRVIQPFTRDELTFYTRNPRNDPEVFGYGYPEIEIALRVIKGFQNALDMNIDIFDRCHCQDTEVLTRVGWKTFGDVSYSDEFATLSKHGVFEYQRASEIVWHDYIGEMYALKSRSFDFLVTPNHRVITQYRPDFLREGQADYVATYARELYKDFQGMRATSRNNYCLPITSSWEGMEVTEKHFAADPPQYKTPPRKITGDDYCAFMGMFLSEGNLKKGNSGRVEGIEIHQRQTSKGFEPFKNLLRRVLGHDAKYLERVDASKFAFGWYGLAEHLTAFGRDCYTKRIPQEILDATPRQQKIFWDYYVLGDGCVSWTKSKNGKRPARQEKITTTSRIMADQLQELAQKMGYAATICETDAAAYIEEGRVINGARCAIKTSVTRYDVLLKTSPMQSFDIEKTFYKGKIGCVTVPNGIIYVRRNGKAAWSGNSAIAQGILTISGGAVTQRQLDLLTRLFTNMKKGITKWWALPVVGIPDGAKLELLDLTRLKGNEAYYKEFMNMLAGALATLWRFPVRRLGYKISGSHKDSEPLPDSSVTMVDEDDPGMAPLLTHWEVLINEYLIWTRWPHLRFRFTGKSPKEDARNYEHQNNSRCWGESRKESNLPPLESITKDKELKDFAKLMALCPNDPNKSGAFQSLAAQWLKLKFEGSQGDPATPGNPSQSKTDPAQSEAHGHTSGVRRDSAAESARAGADKPSS